MTDLNDDQRAIAEECDAVKAMLLEKNANYGNSALDPVRIFSKASAVEQILVRLDDKLSRLKRGSAAGEDIILDTIGYLVLLRIAQRRQPTASPLFRTDTRTPEERRSGVPCPVCKFDHSWEHPAPFQGVVHRVSVRKFSSTRCGKRLDWDGLTAELKSVTCPDCLEMIEPPHPADVAPAVRTVHIMASEACLSTLCGLESFKHLTAGMGTADPMAATCIECKRVYEEGK